MWIVTSFWTQPGTAPNRWLLFGLVSDGADADVHAQESGRIEYSCRATGTSWVATVPSGTALRRKSQLNQIRFFFTGNIRSMVSAGPLFLSRSALRRRTLTPCGRPAFLPR